MGFLTDDMIRLCGEIVTLRQQRRAFVLDLGRHVAELRGAFGRARGERARARLDLQVAVAGLRQDNLLDLLGARQAWRGTASRPGPAPPRSGAKPQVAPAAETPASAPPKSGQKKVRPAPPPTGGSRKIPPAKARKPGGGKGPAGRGPKKSKA